MLKIITLRVKEYFYIPFEWLYIRNSLIWAFYLVFFWKMISNITKILSYEQFIRFSFYYYLTICLLLLFWNTKSLIYEIRSGKFTLYLLYPKDPISFFLLRNVIIPIGDSLVTIIFIIFLKFKITATEILLVLYSSAFLFLFLLFLSLLSANLELNIAQSFVWNISEIGLYPTFVFDERFRRIFYYVIPVVFAGTFPLLLNTFRDQFLSLFYFSFLLSPILFMVNFFLIKNFLRKYQAYGV